MQKCNLDFYLLNFTIQEKLQYKDFLTFFLWYIMDLSSASSVPSIAGYNCK